MNPKDVVLSTRTDQNGMHHMMLTHKPSGAVTSGKGTNYLELRADLQEHLEMLVEEVEKVDGGTAQP